jgi:hypothetical protein
MKRCETVPSAQRQLGCRVGVPKGGEVDTTFWLCNSELFFSFVTQADNKLICFR